MSAPRLAAARGALRVEVASIRRGSDPPAPGPAGLLMLSGVLAREVVIEDIVSTELLGAGDVVAPRDPMAGHDLLAEQVRWQVLADARVAVLDRAVCVAPEIACVLLGRIGRQAERLATLKAISQLNSVERRLLALFRHLADRWGRMTVRGVLVPLTLSHRLLGELIGARRPTVSVALAALARTDTLQRLEDGTWLLTPEPAAAPHNVPRVVPHRRRLVLDGE